MGNGHKAPIAGLLAIWILALESKKIKCWDFPRLPWITPGNATGGKGSMGPKLPSSSLSPRPTSST